MTETYYYSWKNTAHRAEKFYGRPCRVLARGTMNSILIEFLDGREPKKGVVSRHALRKKPPIHLVLGA